jgi:hypothetical protein
MNVHTKGKPAKVGETDGSVAKIQGFIGIIGITVGNVATFITHIDEIRQFVSKVLGTEWAYRLHTYILYGASIFFLLGYGSLTYWLYRNFVAYRTGLFKGAFFAAAFIAVGSTLFGSYEFLLKPVDYAPLVKSQLRGHEQTVLSQQVTDGDDDGGFRFSQTGTSSEAQAWTTAQCLTAILQQDIAEVKQASPAAIRRAFDYLERSRLQSQPGGWGYLRKMDWGVTEIDAWVALAYIYSLRADNVVLIWKPEELPGVVAKTNLALALLASREHDEGGWSVIEKTSDQTHLRTYSTAMAVWALAEAEQNGNITKGHEDEYRKAITLGAKRLLQSYATSSAAFSGWWPNPSVPPIGEYPGLTAQVLFALSEAKMSNAFIGADPKYKEAIEAFIKLAFEGGSSFEPLTQRKVGDNEKAHDSDRYLRGRTETAEQSTFLWYPWTIVMAAALQHDPLLQEYQHEQLRSLLSALLQRSDDENRFIRNDEVIYPTAETLFAEGYYFSKDVPEAVK